MIAIISSRARHAYARLLLLFIVGVVAGAVAVRLSFKICNLLVEFGSAQLVKLQLHSISLGLCESKLVFATLAFAA